MAQVTYEGQPCPHCRNPVIRKEGKIKKKSALRYTYYYEYFYKCMKCRTVYLVPQAKREITEEQRLAVLGTEMFTEKRNHAEALF
jgi:uncharacterized protein with PIN domain